MSWFSQKKKFDFNIDQDVYADFCVACVQANVNANKVVEELIKDYIKKCNNKITKPLEDDICTQENIIVYKPTKEYWIKGAACNEKEFEHYLRQTSGCLVDVVINYKNGNQDKKIWKVNKFTEDTKLNGNLASGYLRDWKTKGITGIRLSID